MATFSGGKGDSLPPCHIFSVTPPPITRCDMIDYFKLTEKISYNKDTGIFTRAKACKGSKLGKILGSKNKNGYLTLSFNSKLYYAHRLAWFYVYKEFPKGMIDHINGLKSDNRIENLRDVSSFENLQNSKLHKDNKSGYKGIWFHKKNKVWRAQIFVKGKKIPLGSHKTAEDAGKAYIEASKIYQTHGIFNNA
jgi:hypothetical protein